MMVLLVEDEELVRDLVKTFLEHGGYQVVVAGDADAALRAIDAHADTVRLVVSDVRLPGIDGFRLAEQLRAKVPGLKFLYMSGHPGESVDADVVFEPGTAFLNKPFTRRILLDKISELLGAPPA
jgi:DNA-binding response OmpR family regulator